MIDITKQNKNERMEQMQALKIELWQEAIELWQEAIDVWMEMSAKLDKLDKLDSIEQVLKDMSQNIVKAIKEEKTI